MDRGTRTHSGGASSGGNGRDERGGDKQNRRPYRDATGDKPAQGSGQNDGGKSGGSHGGGSSGSDGQATGKKHKNNDRLTTSIVEKNGNTGIPSEMRRTIET
ncbi:hypothetical protein BHYA_0147g00160 [Botrytis hyacinthi]|uniref:Uncharacterized protein n=1 Tax=Botrytis hyacinthi TaxID=278943 RepID=A0A4Z1GMM8_9HELO|nr:hypothetical protein BHYA_0147g00160 [Botrytis hyacinthi]